MDQAQPLGTPGHRSERRPALQRWGALFELELLLEATRIAEALPSRATLMMDDDGVHCCHNHAFEYRTAMADWLAATLGTGEDG